MAKTIRVLLVDDHRMFADAVELLLAGYEDIEMIGTMLTGEDALELARRECPDIVLMDIDLPRMDGIEATIRLKEICPDAQVVAITAFQDPEIVARAIEAGACGYVPKTQAAEELVDIIRGVAAGHMMVASSDMATILERLQTGRKQRNQAERLIGRLTNREVEILRAIAEGKSTTEVARSLFISPLTVQSHVKAILLKLGVRSKLEAVTFALRHGLIRVRSEG